jgi:hypothetical protein
MFFQPSHSVLADLLEIRNKADHAAFFLTGDDVRRSRKRQAAVPRDNLVFELGLFMGALGPDRVFAIAPYMERPSLPSDLLGITTLDYYEPDKAGWQSAMGPIATKLKALLSKRRCGTVDLNLIDGGQWSVDFTGLYGCATRRYPEWPDGRPLPRHELRRLLLQEPIDALRNAGFRASSSPTRSGSDVPRSHNFFLIQ